MNEGNARQEKNYTIETRSYGDDDGRIRVGKQKPYVPAAAAAIMIRVWHWAI